MNHSIIYYSDELNDEFAFDTIEPRKIGKDYIYVYHSIFKSFTRFFWYRIIALPPAKLYLKLHFHHKIVNRALFKQLRNTAFFMYGNHTHNMCDALIPTLISFPASVYVIVNPNNISMPVLGKITPSLGAIPLPDDRDSTKNFMDCIAERVKQKKCIAIYPEAHIWPFYTKIRPFQSTSFRYPVEYNVPCICFTNVYRKRKFSKVPQIVTYIDGPFYPDKTLSGREQREDLRNKAFTAMTERAKMNNVELIKYVKKEEAQHD
jgi:1-acyl-sn-glycerol-3-phosphate acyltransferase